MYKIIGADHKEYGPVSAQEIRQWVAEGRANGQTLVQIEGSGEWKPLGSYPEFVGLAYPTPNLPPVGTVGMPTNANALAEHINTTSRDFDLGGCFSRSLKLLMDNFGLLVGATSVIWLLDLVISLIPILGAILHLVLAGIFFGGLYLVYLKRIRGEAASIGDCFLGFKFSTSQLLLAGLITTLLTQIGFMFCIIPGIYLIVAWIFAIPLVADRRLEFWSAMELSRKVVTQRWFKVCGLLFLAFLPFVLFNLYVTSQSASMALHIVQSGPPDLKRFSELFKAAVIWGLIAKIILLFNLPFATGAMLYAYEDLFGTRKTPGA
jgi:GYF domain 2